MVSTLPCADTTPPTQPTNLRTTSTTTTSVTLAWNASTDNVAVTGYDVYRAGTKVGTATTTTYTFNGLTCGTTYTLGVTASRHRRQHVRPGDNLDQHVAVRDQRVRGGRGGHAAKLAFGSASTGPAAASGGRSILTRSSTAPP